jgi:MFS family permease
LTVSKSFSQPERLPFLTLFPSLMLPMFLAVVDQTIVATALPSIGKALGNVESLSWIVAAYLTAATIAAPAFGILGDTFGRKRLLLLALGMISLASIACALSTSVHMLTAARIAQGLGAGGLMTLSQALIGENVPPRERGNFQGYIAGIAVTANTLGPVLGGLLAEGFGWRAVFLINLPIAAIAAILVSRLPASRPTVDNFRFDFPGLLFFGMLVSSVLVAMKQLQEPAEISPLGFGALLSVAAISLPLLLRREKHTATPLLPLTLLRTPSIWRADALAACHGAGLVALITFVPLYLVVMHGVSASEAGLLMLPMTGAIGVSSMITGRMMSRTGHTALFPSLGLIGAALCLLFIAWKSPTISSTAVSMALCMTALCMGTVMGVVQVTVQAVAGPAKLGLAAASVQFSRSIGAALGTAIVGTMLFLVLNLTDPDAAQLFATLIRRGPTALQSIPPALHQSVAFAFQAGFLTIAAFVTTGAVLAWTLPLRRL